MKQFLFCTYLLLLQIGLWGQNGPRMSGLIDVPIGVDSGSRSLLISDHGPVVGLGRQGVVMASLVKQPYGLGLLRNQRLWVKVMRGRQAGSFRVEQGGRFPIKSLRLSADYARILSPQWQMGMRNGIETGSIENVRRFQFESALQIRWQPQVYFWVEWMAQKSWGQITSLSIWNLSSTIGFAWPERAAITLCLNSVSNQHFGMDCRGQVYVHPRAGLYAQFSSIEQTIGIGWWFNWSAVQLFLNGNYHAVLGLSPQLGLQYHFLKHRR